jgi:peptidoglycan/xylan/chitin deacetylase (PgdA/CDA1 family)
MRSKSILCLLCLLFLLFSCQSITRSRTELGIPPSVVYFTFDDGPEALGDTTARLLDVLKKYRIKALFCLLGENAERYPGLVRQIHDEGHYIINHGYSDKFAYKMKRDEFRDNLFRGEAAIANALGHDGLVHRLYRPQGGFYKSMHEKICIDEGYTIVPVTIRVYDAVISAGRQDKAARRIIRKIEKQGGGIVLLHDGRDSHYRRTVALEKNPDGAYNRSWIPETVETIINVLLERGYVLDEPFDLSKF